MRYLQTNSLWVSNKASNKGWAREASFSINSTIKGVINSLHKTLKKEIRIQSIGLIFIDQRRQIGKHLFLESLFRNKAKNPMEVRDEKKSSVLNHWQNRIQQSGTVHFTAYTRSDRFQVLCSFLLNLSMTLSRNWNANRVGLQAFDEAAGQFTHHWGLMNGLEE